MTPHITGLVHALQYKKARLSQLFCVVLLCLFTFVVPCCDVPFDFRIITMFGSSFLQFFVGGLCLIYVIYVCLVRLSSSSLQEAYVLFMLFVFVWFVFPPVLCRRLMSYLCYLCLFGSSFLQFFVGGLCLIYVIYVCLVRLSSSSLQEAYVLFMLFMSVWFVFPPVLCRRLMSYLCYLCLFGSSFLQFFVGGLCLIYVIYVCLVRLSSSSLQEAYVLFMLFMSVWFVFPPVLCRRLMSYLCYLCLFGSSFLQFFVGGLCLIYVIYVCLVRLSSSSLQEAYVLFMLFMSVWFVFPPVLCRRLMSYLCYLCLFGSSFLQFFVGGLCLIYVIYVCLVRLSSSSLQEAYVLFMLFVFVWFVFPPVLCRRLMSYLRYLCLFGSSFLQFFVGGLCLIYVICVCLVRLSSSSLQEAYVLFMLFVSVWFVFPPVLCRRLMSYLCYLCLFGSSFLQFFVGGLCLIYVICVCLVRLSSSSLQEAYVLFMLFMFVWFVFPPVLCRNLMSYLCYLCLFGSSFLQFFVGGLCLIYVIYVCLVRLSSSSLQESYVLFMLFVSVWFVFPPVLCRRLMSYLCYLCLFGSSFLQFFVGGLMSYLCYLCLFGSSFLQFFVGILCLIYVICVCLVRLSSSSLQESYVLFMLFVFVWFVFPPVLCRRLMSYLCYLCLFGSSFLQFFVGILCLIYVICVCLVRLSSSSLQEAYVLFMLFVFVWFVFPPVLCRNLMSYLCYLCLFGSSFLQFFVGGLCLIYVICVCLVRLSSSSLQEAYVLFMLFVFVWFVFPPVLCRRLMSYLCYLCLFAYSVLLVLFVFVLCLVYPMFPVSLDCSFFDCPFSVL